MVCWKNYLECKIFKTEIGQENLEKKLSAICDCHWLRHNSSIFPEILTFYSPRIFIDICGKECYKSVTKFDKYGSSQQKWFVERIIWNVKLWNILLKLRLLWTKNLLCDCHFSRNFNYSSRIFIGICWKECIKYIKVCI